MSLKLIYKKTHFFLAAILVLVVTATQAPFVAHAQWVVTDPGNTAINTKNTVENSVQTGFSVKDSIKEFVLDPLAYAAASKIAERLTNRIVNWANTGFDGNPFYVEDYGELFKDLARETGDSYLMSVDFSNSPFADTVIRALDLAQNGHPIADGFTLEELFGPNWNQFNEDFTVGGWAQYEAVWDPANNPIGAFLIAEQELEARLASKERQVSLDLSNNNGYLSFQRCVNPPDWKPGRTREIVTPLTPEQLAYNASEPNTSLHFTDNGRRLVTEPCYRWETQTPGSAIQNQVTRALDEPLTRLANANSYGEIVAASLNAMIGALVQGGLRELSEKADQGVASIFKDDVVNVSDDTPLAPWNTQARQTIDLEKELNGVTITTDTDRTPLATPIVIPGAISLLEQDLDIIRDIMNNEEYGLRVFPELIMELDHELPGPDRGWVERMREALSSNNRYEKLRRKAEKDRDIGVDEEEILIAIDATIARETPRVLIEALKPENNIDNFFDYFTVVQRVDEVEIELEELQAEMVRKSKILALLRVFKEKLEDPNTTTEEKNELALQYTRLREIPTTTFVKEQEVRREQLILLKEQIESDIQEVRDLVRKRKNEDPQWGAAYDSRTLFCSELVDAINDKDDKIDFSCDDFYTSSLVDYVSRYVGA